MPYNSFPCSCPRMPPLSSSSLPFCSGSLALLCWCSAGNSPSARAGGDQREKDSGTVKEKRKREGTKKEKVPVEALQRSPCLQVQLLKLFQMWVREALHVIRQTLKATLWYNPRLHLVLLFRFFSSSLLSDSRLTTSNSLLSSRAMRCSCYQRQKKKTPQNTPSPYNHCWNLQRIKERSGGQCYSMCVYESVYTVELFWSPAPKASAVTRKKIQPELAERDAAWKRRSELFFPFFPFTLCPLKKKTTFHEAFSSSFWHSTSNICLCLNTKIFLLQYKVVFARQAQ